MKFGEIILADAVGAILAHGMTVGGRKFSKGRVLSAEDVQKLRDGGVETVVAAVLEAGDVGEDEAARRIGDAARGANVTATKAFTGRVNLYAGAQGLAVYDSARLGRINSLDESITVAALTPFSVVGPGEMIATVKIIPFAVRADHLRACLREIGTSGGLFRVAPFLPQRVGLIQTVLPGTREKVLNKTVDVMRARIEAVGGTLAGEKRCPHRAQDVAEAIQGWVEDRCTLVLVSGASAITDRRDVVPAAIEASGGIVEHFGMPVDPGNLMLMGRHGDVAVVGLPGCVRSPKLNGFDWVLQRLAAGLRVGAGDIMAMGAGGLLTEIGSRPLPRAEATSHETAPHAARIAGIVLAAGRSRRMGTVNKLLADIRGKTMVAHVVDAVLASRARPVIVVTGHEAERIGAALADREVAIVANPDYADGISTSLRVGLRALPENIDGALVCLGDMPRVTTAQIDRLIDAFSPVEGRAICVPTFQGKRGNPVLFARRFFEEMESIAGDVGARHLIGQCPDLVCEVPMDDRSILLDIDTPESLARVAD